MGSTASTPLSTQEKVRKQQLERMGVLIPPSFGVCTEALPPSSARTPSQSYLESLEKDLLCYRILHDHMTSGLWVSATTPSQASVLASFAMPDGRGMLSACQKWNHGQADIFTYTFAPAIASAHYTLVPGWNFYGSVSASGLGWLGCYSLPLEWLKRQPSSQATTYYRNNPFVDEEQKASRSIQKIQIGSSLQVQSPCKVTKLSDIAVQDFRGYASIDVAGCTVAMEATVPLNTLDPQVAYHISCDLSTDEQGAPPIIVSMQSSPTRSSMNLSQVLTFDRYVLNVFETRCPRVRNTLGWAVQMEKENGRDTQLTAGLAWQLNRAVCVKMVVNPTDGGVTGAVLLKRWRQPRVLCSLLAGIAAPGKKPSFGFGLELETGPQQHGQDYYRDKEERRGHVEEEAPATKVTLPNVD